MQSQAGTLHILLRGIIGILLKNERYLRATKTWESVGDRITWEQTPAQPKVQGAIRAATFPPLPEGSSQLAPTLLSSVTHSTQTTRGQGLLCFSSFDAQSKKSLNIGLSLS